MVPKPIALGLTLCEKVIVEEGTKNVTLVNIFTKMYVEEFPSPPQRFAAFAMLKGGQGDGIIQIAITHLENDEEVYTLQNVVHFPDRLVEVRVLFRMSDVAFPAPSRYQVTLLIDGDWIAHRDLLVARRS
jgi:hypothetical protein